MGIQNKRYQECQRIIVPCIMREELNTGIGEWKFRRRLRYGEEPFFFFNGERVWKLS